LLAVTSMPRAPLNMSQISSRFRVRHHPVLRFTRLHSDVDFAARPRHAKVYGLL
jgi:hypothetical protein